MITIGYSTRKSDPEFQEYLKKSCGFPKAQIIEKVNNGEKGLTTVYNEILQESENDIIVFCHDDITVETKQWGQKLVKLFLRNPEFGIIGVAGTKHIPQSGMWWEDRSKMYGKVLHTHEGKTWLSEYSPDLNQVIEETIVVDGLFFGIDKTKIKKEFDIEFEGFHFYDVSFCFENFISGVKNGVTTLIRVNHKSIGMTNDKWEKNRIQFSEKYKDNLPVTLQKVRRKGEILRAIICFDTFESKDFEKYFYLVVNQLLNDNYNITVSSNIKPETIEETLRNKINFTSINEPPGLRIGDGKWIFNSGNVKEVSKPNTLYKIKDVSFDLIIFNKKEVYNHISRLYQNTELIPVITDFQEILETPVIDPSVIKYVVFDEMIKDSLSKYYSIDIEKIEIPELSINVPRPKIKKIKIVSGWSNRGGSTVAFINLTNELNKLGYDVTFYGPHDWHLNKCKSDKLDNLKLDTSDILITHFINLPSRPNVRKVILSCHEKDLFEVGKITQFWDEVVFLNDSHREYHNLYNGEYSIIPNLKQKLIKKDKKGLELIAGVIGSFDKNKQTHVSIERALSDGCQKVYLFGEPNTEYFENKVRPLLSDKVVLKGFLENKQEIYDMIGRAYLSSNSEVATLVKDECELTGVKFYGNEVTNNPDVTLTNKEILDKWIKLMNNE
jgi:hypothetical protein